MSLKTLSGMMTSYCWKKTERMRRIVTLGLSALRKKKNSWNQQKIEMLSVAFGSFQKTQLTPPESWRAVWIPSGLK